MTVINLGYKAKFSTSYIRVSCIEQFNKDPVAQVWDYRKHEPDLQATYNWLENNTPGWKTLITTDKITTIELPIGRDATGQFLQYHVYLEFVSPKHLELWNARVARILQEKQELQARVKKLQETVSQGTEICDDCATIMVQETVQEIDRIAQFEFMYQDTQYKCPNCGLMMVPGSNLAHVLVEARDRIADRVGLPSYGDSMWTEEIGKEWRCRKQAPPEISIVLTEATTVDGLLEKLDSLLVKSGRVLLCKPKLYSV